MTAPKRRPAARKGLPTARLGEPDRPVGVYILAALAALGVGTVLYWLYLLASLVA